MDGIPAAALDPVLNPPDIEEETDKKPPRKPDGTTYSPDDLPPVDYGYSGTTKGNSN